MAKLVDHLLREHESRERPNYDLDDVINGRHPVIHVSLVRAPEHDTETMAGFRTEWRPIGGGPSITLLSLTPRDQLAAYGDLAYKAVDP